MALCTGTCLDGAQSEMAGSSQHHRARQLTAHSASWHAQMGNLVPCIRNALLKGYIAPPVLAPRIVGARQQWLDWHHDFAANQLPAAVAEDLELARKADAMDNRAEVVVLDPADTALQVNNKPSLIT